MFTTPDIMRSRKEGMIPQWGSISIIIAQVSFNLRAFLWRGTNQPNWHGVSLRHDRIFKLYESD